MCKPTPSGHALLSPSSASRWRRCPNSVALTADLPKRRDATEYSAWGTAAHEVAEHVLRTGAPLPPVGLVVHADGYDIEVDADFIACVQAYTDFVKGHPGIKRYEVKLPIGHLTGEPGATGTADCVVLDVYNGILTVIDLKGGKGVKVFAEENDQMLIYASAAMDWFEDALGENLFQTFHLKIAQPRLDHFDTYEVSRKQLLGFQHDLAVDARNCWGALELVRTTGQADEGFYGPGEKSCQWCPLKAVCPALEAHVRQIVLEDFADISERTPAATLGEARAFLDIVYTWADAVRDEVEARLVAGEPVPGWKLVAGRGGNRRWVTDGDGMEFMQTAGIEPAEVVLKSVTAAEKELKALKSPALKSLPDYVTRSPARPAVVPEKDPRPAWEPEQPFERLEP